MLRLDSDNRMPTSTVITTLTIRRNLTRHHSCLHVIPPETLFPSPRHPRTMKRIKSGVPASVARTAQVDLEPPEDSMIGHFAASTSSGPR